MPSEIALLRKELAHVIEENRQITETATDMVRECGTAIHLLAEAMERMRDHTNILQKKVAGLEKRLGITASWNGRPSESKEYVVSRAEFRALVAEHEAKKAKCDSGSHTSSQNGDNGPCSGDCNAQTASLLHPTKRLIGGQPGHEGKSREGKCEETFYFVPAMCGLCGGTDLFDVKCVRKRVHGNISGENHCYMYVLYHMACRVCRAVMIPHTDAIAGSAFLAHERGIMRTYNAGGTSAGTAHGYLRDLHSIHISVGAISNCTSAMADEIDGPIVCVPEEAPIALDDHDLRIWRMPVLPRTPATKHDKIGASSPYSKLEAMLTERSTVWTQSATLPVRARIIEMASMDPYVESDESPHHVGKQAVQTLVASTRRTVQIKVVKSKDVKTVQQFLEWMRYRHGIRDGADLYRWCCAEFQRCLIHIGRKVEGCAMCAGLDSDEYVRYVIFGEIYHEAKEAAAEITKAAGGPIKSACDMDIIQRTGLTDMVDSKIAKLTDKANMAADMIDDGAAVTMRNAAGHMFTSLRYPGAPLHTNRVEGNIRDHIVTHNRKIKGPFSNWKAADNFSINQTFAATCKINGISVYAATIQMAGDPDCDIFNACIPPPILISHCKQHDSNSIRP